MYNKLKRLALLFLIAIMLLSSFSFTAATSSSIKSSPNAISLKKAKVSYPKKKAYTGAIHEIPVKVTLNGETLVEGVDYLISGNETSGAKAKKYKISFVIVGIGHYKGFITKSFSYTITKVSQKLSVKAADETQTVVVNYSDLKSGSQTVQVNIEDTVLGESITPKLVWKTTKKIKAYQNGTIVIPKGLKKGTYTLKVYAQSSTNYNKSSYQYIKIKVV